MREVQATAEKERTAELVEDPSARNRWWFPGNRHRSLPDGEEFRTATRHDCLSERMQEWHHARGTCLGMRPATPPTRMHIVGPAPSVNYV